jgi:hypothetical protein
MSCPLQVSRQAIAAVLSLFVLSVAQSADVPTTQPIQGTTRPAELPPDIAVAIHQLNAADQSLVPTILLWLGSEQDGLAVGKGPPRLRLACGAVKRFRLKQAVPRLVELYDNPTAAPTIRDMAAEAAIRVDPYYSFEFLRDVLNDGTLPPLSTTDQLSAAQRAAAGALAAAGNEDARTLLLDAYKAYLNSLSAGGQLTGVGARNYEISYELSKLSDPVLIDRVKALRDSYPQQPARTMLDSMIDQLYANLQPDDLLLQMARSDKPQDGRRRTAAIIALGHKAGPEMLSALRTIRETREAATQPATSQPATTEAATTEPATTEAATTQVSTTQVSTTQVSTTQVAATQPATRPAKADEFLIGCRNAIWEIESRNPVPVADLPGDPAATQPVTFAGERDVPADGEVVRPEGAMVRRVNGVPSRFFVVNDPAGILNPMQLLVRDEALFGQMQFVSYGTLARLKLSDDRTELLALKLLRPAPGESAPMGYVFVDRRTVNEGKWQHLTVVLRKFDQETTFTIPNRRHGDDYVPDAQMASAAQAMKPGDAVIAGVDAGPGPAMLTFLAPYSPPVSARFIRLVDLPVNGNARPGIEVIVARKRMSYPLPQDGSAVPTLDPATLKSLPIGTNLKLTLDADAKPPAARSIRLDAGIAWREDGSVAVRCGRASYIGKRDDDFRGMQRMTHPPDHELSKLSVGLSRFLQDAKLVAQLPPETVQSLRQADLSLHSAAFPASDLETLQSLLRQWASADPPGRPEFEMQMELLLAKVGANLGGREETARARVKSLVSPAQYKDIIRMGNVRPITTETQAPLSPAEDAAQKAKAAAQDAADAAMKASQPTTKP